MTTLVEARGPAPRPKEPVATPAGPIRYVAIRANLLPTELIAARRAGVLKRRLVAGLALLVVVLAALYLLAKWATSGARSDLAGTAATSTQLQAEQRQYQPLVEAENQAAAISQALQKLMVGDLPWTQMLTTLRSKAGNGIVLTGVNATLTSGAATGTQPGGPAGLSLLNPTGKPEVGTLTLAGTAPDKAAVATYVDQLGTVKGLASPFPASVTDGKDNTVTFSVNVLITTDALGGRFAPPAAGSGSQSGAPSGSQSGAASGGQSGAASGGQPSSGGN